MEINRLNTYFTYSNSSNTNLGKVSKTSISPSTQDKVEISEYAQNLLKTQGMPSTDEKTYSLQDILALHYKEHRTQEESEAYHAARRNDPKLDQALYDQDKAEALEFINKVQNILLKALTNQELTPEEEKMVKEDVYLQQEIQHRKIQP